MSIMKVKCIVCFFISSKIILKILVYEKTSNPSNKDTSIPTAIKIIDVEKWKHISGKWNIYSV